MEDEFLEPTRRQSGQGADGMTDEEIERFALVLKECERIRALIAREEAALSNGEHDHGIPICRCAARATAARAHEGHRRLS